MAAYVGIACGECDAFCATDANACLGCGAPLVSESPSIAQPPPASVPAVAPVSAPGHLELVPEPTPLEGVMEQSRNYVCRECSSPVPSAHKFCGACGATVPDEIQHLYEEYFGAMQTPGKARLILIRGDQGVDGLSYLLQGTEHVAGREDAQILFPEDRWLNPRHANFIYRGEKLVVRDEGSVNGIYVRIRDEVTLEAGDQFMCGEQVFRVDLTPRDTAGPDGDHTYFYSSPKRTSPFRVVQVLAGGADGMVYSARENAVAIGREDCDMNFPEDVYMSVLHARIEMTGTDEYTLSDNGSRNGTYVRVRQETELGHGDYLFLGHQLLRVEMTA